MAQEWEERCQLYIDIAIDKLEPLAKQGVLGGGKLGHEVNCLC